MRKVFLFQLVLFVQHAFAQSINSELARQILTAKPGEAINLTDFINRDFPKIGFQKIVMPGPQYIISDDPEYIRLPEAIALKELVQPGAVRLYVYNVNGVKEPNKIPRKITAVIKNTGTQNLHLKMLKFVSQKPSNDYFKLGKNGLNAYFQSKPLTEIIEVKPGEVAPIDPNLEEYIVNYDELVHGIYEFVIDQPAEIAVLQTSPQMKGKNAYMTIDTIVSSSHKNAGRGLFGVSNYLLRIDSVLDTKNNASQLIIADGKDDAWVLGKEYTSGKIASLAGNYGVMYDIELNWKSTNGKALALLTWNSRTDNKWCSGLANCMLVGTNINDQEIINIPSNKLITTGFPEAVVVKVFKPKNGQEIQHIKLTYSPPGASCLPTPLIFVPIDF